MAEVRQILQTSRLLTLVGAGGSGKTRLADQVGREILVRYEDGVFWVELAPLTDPALVPQAAANAAGLRENPQLGLAQILVDYFKERKALLLFDNCDHLLAGCAGLIEKLLTGTASLHVLATSRERLHIPGETIYLVPSLSTPTNDWQAAPPVERLLEYEAIRLFSERARSVENGFHLTEQNAATVAQVCYRLDGIPLAIELAERLSPTTFQQQESTWLDTPSKKNITTCARRWNGHSARKTKQIPLCAWSLPCIILAPARALARRPRFSQARPGSSWQRGQSGSAG